MGTRDAFDFVPAQGVSGRAGRGAPSASRPGEVRHEPEHDRRTPSDADRASAVRYCISNDLI